MVAVDEAGGESMKDEKIKKIVREGYAKVAKKETSCCTGTPAPCSCSTPTNEEISKKIGYSEKDINSVPEGANLGLGCGNPVALASLKKGETVLDLGSGAGFDCFLAANRVGNSGKVIGVDMTPEMVEKAKANVKKGNYRNIEFRLGEIEKLPVDSNSVDIIISNCVINLSPEKKSVFREAFRVLKPGGRLMISDLVLLKELPDFIKNSIEAYVGCISGAIMKEEYIEAIKAAGFQKVKIIDETTLPVEGIMDSQTAKAIIENLGMPIEKLKELKDIANSVVSIKVYGVKPNQTTQD